MASPVDRIARGAAQRLAVEADLPALVPEVERQLMSGSGPRPPERFEPVTITISVAALLVNVAGLAWKVYTDLRKQTSTPEPEVIKRRIRVEAELPEQVTPTDRDLVITAVVEQALMEVAEPEQPGRNPTA